MERRKFLAILGLGAAATLVKLPEAKALPAKKCGPQVLFDTHDPKNPSFMAGVWGAVIITDSKNVTKRWHARTDTMNRFARESLKAVPDAREIIVDWGDECMVRYTKFFINESGRLAIAGLYAKGAINESWHEVSNGFSKWFCQSWNGKNWGRLTIFNEKEDA